MQHITEAEEAKMDTDGYQRTDNNQNDQNGTARRAPTNHPTYNSKLVAAMIQGMSTLHPNIKAK